MCSLDARVLFNPGASHSFVSPVFASRMEWQPSKMLFPLSVTTPLSDELETDVFFPSCPVLVEGRELLANLILLDVLEFDVILEMNLLARHYASLNCQEKVVTFRIPNDDEFRFRGDKASIPQNLIFAITARKKLRRGCQGYLVVVRNVEANKGAVDRVPVLCEFPNVFLEELPGLPPDREIEFYIDDILVYSKSEAEHAKHLRLCFRL